MALGRRQVRGALLGSVPLLLVLLWVKPPSTPDLLVVELALALGGAALGVKLSE
jgi:uncharacterized membrane protein YccC